MSRVLFWLALAFLVLMALRSKLRGMRMPPPQAPPRRELPDAEVMLCCAQCGLYYPASETVKAHGLDYCSAAHVPPP
jgi:uncharacterized protein